MSSRLIWESSSSIRTNDFPRDLKKEKKKEKKKKEGDNEIKSRVHRVHHPGPLSFWFWSKLTQTSFRVQWRPNVPSRCSGCNLIQEFECRQNDFCVCVCVGGVLLGVLVATVSLPKVGLHLGVQGLGVHLRPRLGAPSASAVPAPSSPGRPSGRLLVSSLSPLPLATTGAVGLEVSSVGPGGTRGKSPLASRSQRHGHGGGNL